MKTILSIALSPIIMTLIGVGITAGIYETNKKKYMQGLAIIQGADTAWLYLAAWFYSCYVVLLNLYPMMYKSKIMQGGFIRANMFFYQSLAANGSKSAVVMANDGEEG